MFHGKAERGHVKATLAFCWKIFPISPQLNSQITKSPNNVNHITSVLSYLQRSSTIFNISCTGSPVRMQVDDEDEDRDATESI